MSKIVAIFESAEITAETFNSLLQGISSEKEKSYYAKRPVHIAFQKGDNWCVIDVWNSQEELNDFAMNVLMPVFAQTGITPPAPQIYPIYHFLNAGGE